MQFRDLKQQYQVLKKDIDKAMVEVATNCNFINGQQVKDLEKELAEYVGVKHCVTCANGTDALTMAMMAWGIKEGDAVFVPDFTFFSSGEIVSHAGATPVFVDVDLDTFNISVESLEAAIEKVIAEINGIPFYFYTDNGVFSKGELDFGTELLLKNFKYDNPNNKTLLDIGCGCGPIGIYASHLGFTVDMSDVNKRAIHLSKMSLKEQGLNANVFESDAYKNITNKYDYIVSNPPIRVGKEKLYEIVMNAKEHLKDGGSLWIVVRKQQGAESMLRDMKNAYKIVEVIAKKKGFFIIKASLI